MFQLLFIRDDISRLIWDRWAFLIFILAGSFINNLIKKSKQCRRRRIRLVWVFCVFYRTSANPCKIRWWLRLRRLLCLCKHVTTTTVQGQKAFWSIFDPTVNLTLTFGPQNLKCFRSPLVVKVWSNYGNKYAKYRTNRAIKCILWHIWPHRDLDRLTLKFDAFKNFDSVCSGCTYGRTLARTNARNIMLPAAMLAEA